MEIEFVSEKFELPFKSHVMKKWIGETIVTEGKIPGRITYVFLTDEELLKYNIQYLQHDYYTDIITFDDSDFPQVNGDLLISFERVQDNSMQINTTFEIELARVMIHGVLHLCGYGDKSAGEEQEMRHLEDHYLAKLDNIENTFHVKQSE
jgi:rRNA maturation RNase YbeY